MKRCESCQMTFEKGNFCKNCGEKLVDIEPLVETPVVTPVETPEEIESLKEENITEENIVEQVMTTSFAESVVEETPLLSEEIIKTEAVVKGKKTKDKPKKEKKVKEKKAKEKKVKEKKVKEKKIKEKKKKSKIITFLLSMVILFLLLVIAGGIYLNFFQIEIDKSEAIEFDQVKKGILEDNFDGEDFDFKADKDLITYVLNDWFEKDGKNLAFGLTVVGIGYDGSKESILINVENPLIHTTLVFKTNVKYDDQMMKVSFEKVSLGKFYLPIPAELTVSKLELPKNFKEGVKLPIFIEDATLDFTKDGADISAELDLYYFEDLFLDSFENIANYYDYGITVNSETKTIHEFYALKDDWSDRESADFLEALASDEAMVVAYLALLDSKYAKDLLDDFLSDLLYVNEDKKETTIKDYKEFAEELEEGYVGYLDSNKKEAYLTQADELLESYYNYLYDQDMNQYIIGFKGRPFDARSKSFIDKTFKNDFNYGEDDYILILDNYYFSALDTELGFLVYEDNLNYEWYDSKDDFLSRFDYDDNFKFKSFTLYKKASKDRVEIEAAISNYEGYSDGVWINYLAGDGESAFAVAAEIGDSQTLSQYTFVKKEGVWQIDTVYPDFNRTDDMAFDYLENYDEQAFNVSVLPSYNLNDYYIWRYTPDEIAVIKDYLMEEGYTKDSMALNYFRRIDDYMVLGYENGDLYYFEFEVDSTDSFVNFIVILNGESSEEAISDLLMTVDPDTFPSFLFVQP